MRACVPVAGATRSSRSFTRLRLASFVGCLALVADVSLGLAGGVPITQCGAILEGKKGVLMNDLDCSSFRAVTLLRSRLDLNGFTIMHSGGGSAVRCVTTCTISGPGTITGSPGCGVVGDTDNMKIFGVARVKITDGVNVTGNACGVNANTTNDVGELVGSVSVQDASISGNAGHGVVASRSVRLKRAVVTGNATYGVGDGVSAGSRRPLKANIKDSDVSGNGATGVTANVAAKIIDSAVVGNGIHGASASRLRIRGTMLTGNGTDAGCGVTQTCADLASRLDAPKIRGATLCETSYVLDSGFPGTSLGLCSLD